MTGTNGGRLAAVVTAVWLAATGTAAAGPLLGWWHKPACPPGSYSPHHYWLPTLDYIRACRQGTGPYTQPVDRHPELPLRYRVQSYPCPPVAPLPFSAGHALPPAVFTGE